MLSAVTNQEVPARRIVSLAASAFVVLAAEPLFLLVDTAVVGHLGQTQLAGLGAAGTIMTLLGLIGSSLEYGTTGRAARFFGAGRRDAAVNEGVQASWLAVLIGAVAIAVGELVAVPVTRLIVGSDGPVLTAAVQWLRIAILGLPGILLTLAGNGWLRGVQDTRTPVVIVVAANVMSAIASPLLVYPGGLGIRGSAIANVVAQCVAGALCVRALRREHVPGHPQWRVMRGQLVVSRDLVVRSAAFQASYMTATGVAGRMGSAQLAAHQIGLQLWELIALLLDSFAIAAQSLVGASLGGGDAAAATRTAWRVTRYGLIAGVSFAVVVGSGWYVIPLAFTSSSAVQHQAHLLWPWMVAMMPVCGVLFALDGVLFGAGDNAFMRNATLAGAVLGYIPVALCALAFGWGIGGVWAGLSAFILLRFVAIIWRVRSGRWLVVGETRD
ncbi:MATE family efflux transporter [Acidothermaceae bacterium B102]|nr:MATE family efflux transporter [Acidothermaceae bacterium B102]